MKFDGEFIRKLKFGKGKEYYKKELIFEGEYFIDKRWKGKGKEYNKKDLLTYEGEYLNGLKWTGIGYDYDDDDDELTFKIKYLNGKKIFVD